MSWIFEVDEIDSKELEVEARFAELFLRANGKLTYQEWCELPPLDAMALVLAGDRVNLQAHLDQALANRGPEGAARLMARLDEGQTFRDLRLRTTIEEIGRRMDASS